MADWNQHEKTIRQRALREVLAGVEELKAKVRRDGNASDWGQRRMATRIARMIEEKIG